MTAPTRTRTLRLLLGASPPRRRRAAPRPTRLWRDDSGMSTVEYAIGTVAAHAIRVARTNPIHALRYE